MNLTIEELSALYVKTRREISELEMRAEALKKKIIEHNDFFKVEKKQIIGLSTYRQYPPTEPLTYDEVVMLMGEKYADKHLAEGFFLQLTPEEVRELYEEVDGEWLTDEEVHHSYWESNGILNISINRDELYSSPPRFRYKLAEFLKKMGVFIVSGSDVRKKISENGEIPPIALAEDRLRLADEGRIILKTQLKKIEEEGK